MSELRSGRYDGVLRNPGRGFLIGLPGSIGLHLLLLGAFLLVGMTGGRERDPLLDKDIYMVSAVVLPRSEGLPDKATAPKPAPKEEAPPIVEGAMVLPEPAAEPEPTPKATPRAEATPKPEPTPKRNSRDDLLAAVGADESDQSRFATDPDGVEGAEPSSFAAFDGVRLSPYQRRLTDRIKDNWHPGSRRGKYAPGKGNIDMSLKAVVQFRIKDDGAITSPSVAHPSGDPVFDQSCLLAVTRTRRFDAPPEGEATRIQVLFDPRDKQ